MPSIYLPQPLGLTLFWTALSVCVLAQVAFLVGAFRKDLWVGLASLFVPPLGWGLAFYAPASARQRAFATVTIAALIVAIGLAALWTGAHFSWFHPPRPH